MGLTASRSFNNAYNVVAGIAKLCGSTPEELGVLLIRNTVLKRGTGNMWFVERDGNRVAMHFLNFLVPEPHPDEETFTVPLSLDHLAPFFMKNIHDGAKLLQLSDRTLVVASIYAVHYAIEFHGGFEDYRLLDTH